MRPALRARHPGEAGFSLMELMISITIGLLLLTGVASLFSKSSISQNEIRRSAAQIENGRYAMDTMVQDLQMAGYFGQYRTTSFASSLPDPCAISTSANVQALLQMPVLGYGAAGVTSYPDISATTCGTYLPNTNLAKGSGILVVVRSDSNYVPISTTTTAGTWYLQTNPASFEVQNGGGTTSCTSKADGSASSITRRCLTPSTSDPCSAICPAGSPVGFIRQVHVNIYFVAPCNVPSTGVATDACTGSSDDGGRPVPTLKRLELYNNGGVPGLTITPIASGVEFLQVGYGIDDTPSATNPDTGMPGDGAPDRFVNSPSATDLKDVVTVRLDMLVRNPEPSVDYTDNKVYALGRDPIIATNAALTITASTDLASALKYRRHVYSSTVRLVNLSSRKENP